MPMFPELRNIGIYNRDGILVSTQETIESAALFVMDATGNTNLESLYASITMSLRGVREYAVGKLFYVREFDSIIPERILPPQRRNAADDKLNTECHAYLYDRTGKFLYEVFYYMEIAHILTFSTFVRAQNELIHNGFHYGLKYYLLREDYGDKLPRDILWKIKAFHRKSKLTVYVKNLATGEEYEYTTAQEAAEALGIGKSHISECLNNQRNRIHCHGYSFAYKKTGLLHL